MRVIIDIDERYARVLCFTAIKTGVLEAAVTTACVDLEVGQYMRIDNAGKLHQSKEWEGGE